MKKNLLKIYEGFFDDLDQLNKNQDDGFRGTNANIYDEHNYILSPEKNPEFFEGLCEMCKQEKIPYNENGFTQEDLDNITCIIYNNVSYETYFKNITSLDELKYFHNLERIYSWSFEACKKLKSIIFPEKNNLIIHDNAFVNCFSLENLYIPKNIIEIGNYSFAGCFHLKKIIISKNIKKISNTAFYDCVSSSLKEIIIPKNFKNRIEDLFGKIDLSKVNITYI